MFPVGHTLRVNNGYVKNILAPSISKSTLAALGYIADDEINVLATGELPDLTQTFIQVLPVNSHNPTFNNGSGVTLFFPKKEYLLEAFTDLTTIRKVTPKTFLGFNNTPRLTIPAFHLVKLGYYSRVVEAHIIEIIAPDDWNPNIKYGITEEAIPSGLFGKVTQVS